MAERYSMKTGELVNGSQWYGNAFTETDLENLRIRNEARAKRAAAALGTTYLLHPANKVKRVDRPFILTPHPLQF